MCLHLDLNHLEGSAQDTAQNIGIPHLVLGPAVVRQLDKVGKRQLIENKRELLAVAGPIGDGGSGVEKDLETDLLYVSKTLAPVT